MPTTAPSAFVGIDLGGTNMQIGVVSPALKILGRAKKKTKADEGPDAILTRIVQGVEEACADAKLPLTSISALGIGAPGAIDPDKGLVREAANLRWNDLPLAALLRKRLKIPVIVDNDVNVAVVGEHRQGAGKGASHLLGVWVGTGIGGGLILSNALHYGHFLSAGEIGHTILFPGNPRGHRSLEHNCSRTAVAERLARLLRSNHKSALAKEEGALEGDIKSKSIARHYHDGDRLVTEVVDHAADLLGIAIANAVTLLALERVVLGGGLTEALGEPFVKRVRDSVRAYVFPDACREVDVLESKLRDDAGVIGSAILASERASTQPE